MYQHHNWQGELINLPVGKVVCVGSNYAHHIKEMDSAWPEEPLLFIKPETALCSLQQPLDLFSHQSAIHYETEMAILIGYTLKQAKEDEVGQAIAGYGIALDLTLRDLQAEFKCKGQPWEKAKGFDGSCPISGFITPKQFTSDPQHTDFQLWINAELRQHSNTSNMVFSIKALIAYISQYFTLKPGDIVLTGTPAGVGPLYSGDKLKLVLGERALETYIR